MSFNFCIGLALKFSEALCHRNTEWPECLSASQEWKQFLLIVNCNLFI
jgi:hypothetical protein